MVGHALSLRAAAKRGLSGVVPLARVGVAAGVLVAGALQVGCDRRATQLLIDVSSNLEPADRACIFVEAGPYVGGTTTFTARQELSVDMISESFGVVPPLGDPDARIEVRVSALRDCGDDPATAAVVSRTIRTGFIRERTVEIPIFLSRECVGVPCGVDLDCDRGRCVPVDVEPMMTDAGPPTTPDAGIPPSGCMPRGPVAWFTGAPISFGFDAVESGGGTALAALASNSTGTAAYYEPMGGTPSLERDVYGALSAMDVLARPDGSLLTVDVDTEGNPRLNEFQSGGFPSGLGIPAIGTLPRRALVRVGANAWYAWVDGNMGNQTDFAEAVGGSPGGFNLGTLAAPGTTEVTLGHGGVAAWVNGTTCTLARFSPEGIPMGTAPIDGMMECHTPEPFVSDTGGYGIAFTGRDDGGTEGVFFRSYDASLAPREAAPIRIGVPAVNIVALAGTAGGFSLLAVTSAPPAIQGFHVDADGDVVAIGSVAIEGSETAADLATLRASRVREELYVAWRTPTRVSYSVLCDAYLGRDL